MTPKKHIRDIEKVFGSDPRTGNSKGSYWWPRRKADEQFYNALYVKGKSVCIDGPTGSGKTSLALTGFKLHKFKYCWVTVPDKQFTWKGLCRDIVTVPRSSSKTGKINFKFGIKHLIPEGEVDLSFEKQHQPIHELEYADKYLETINQSRLAELLSENETTLFLDDFENANRELVTKIASLIKTLAKAKYSRPAKVVITAADGSFGKLLNANMTIKGRLQSVTLGGLTEKWESWDFMQRGFNQLDILHPGSSRIEAQKKWKPMCQEAAYDATGGGNERFN